MGNTKNGKFFCHYFVFGHIVNLLLCNTGNVGKGGGGCWEQHYDGVQSNIISITRKWGVSNFQNKSYVPEWSLNYYA